MESKMSTPVIRPIYFELNNSHPCKLTKPGNYIIGNSSLFDSMKVFGGTNSTMHFELGPMSSAKVLADPEINIFTESPEFFPISISGPYPVTNVPINPAPDSYMLKGKKIYIDAGHGGKDPGAVNTRLDLQEKDAALAIALLLREQLDNASATTYMSRTEDFYTSPGARAREANQLGVDLYVSVHLNSADNQNAYGLEVLCYKTDSNAGRLAKYVLDNILELYDTKNRGVKARPDLTVLSDTKMPAILVETDFISNDEKAAQLFVPDVQLDIATGIYNGIVEYYR